MKRVVFACIIALLMSTAAWAKVNINTATVAELEALPGIGQVKAEAIVAYRDANGKFKKSEDIVMVKGIGDKLYKKISGEIEVGK